MKYGSGVWATAGRAPGRGRTVFDRLGGYGDMNGADRLGLDPAI